MDLNFKENDPEFAIEKLYAGSTQMAQLWVKHETIRKDFSEFWRPRSTIGKKCMDFMRRDIFSTATRQKYLNVQDKWPIEPQVLKPVIDTLAAQIANQVKSYTVTSEDSTPPENSAKPEVIATVLDWIGHRLKIDRKRKRVLRDGLITGYPVWIMFDSATAMDGVSPECVASVLPWDSTVCSPTFLEDDGQDITEIFVVHKLTREQARATYPDRWDEFVAHENGMKKNPDYMDSLLSGTLNADDRANIFFEVTTSGTLNDKGLLTIVEHYFSIKDKAQVYADPETGDARVLPKDWSPQRKQKWLEENPQYRIGVTQNFPKLWVTTIGSTGFVWENKEHWFQEINPAKPQYCLLPCVPYIADLVDGVPIGKGEDLLPLIVMKATCETEGLAEVRKGARSMTWAVEGAFKQPGRIASEMQKEDGIGLLKKGVEIGRDIKTEYRSVNPVFAEQSQRVDEMIDKTHGLTNAMQGGYTARQSANAMQSQIQNGLAPQSQYVENFNSFNINMTQHLCLMIPYFITEEMVIVLDDEYGGKKDSVTVNQTEFDAEGNQTIVANDVVSMAYRVVPTPGDDSPTTRERDMISFSQMLEAFGNTILKLDPKLVAHFFLSFPNRMARECGKFMLENAGEMSQAQAQQAQKEFNQETMRLKDKKEVEFVKAMVPKLMMKLAPEDIQAAPEGFWKYAEYVDALQKQAAAMAQTTDGSAPANMPPIPQVPNDMPMPTQNQQRPLDVQGLVDVQTGAAPVSPPVTVG